MEVDKEKIYIDMLHDTLLQKDGVMDRLLELTKQQEEVLKSEQFKEDEFSNLISEKDIVIKQLNDLDDGFERIYSKVQEEIKENKERYKEKIIRMQELIQRTIEKGLQLKGLELQNQKRLEICLAGSRNKIKEFKVNRQAASNYYKNMSKLQTSESYFMDKKR